MLWLAGVIAAVVIGSTIYWRFWDELGSDTESLSTTIRNVALVIGGVIAVLLAMWRSRVAERQAATAQQGLLNERYQKGAEMLGSEVLAVRMGGIYALQRLAEEYLREYHVQIMGLLCAFVRHPTRDEAIMSASNSQARDDDPKGHLRQDVQAVMEVIQRRSKAGVDLEEESRFVLDLRGADLRWFRLGGAKLSKANLDGAQLSGAQLTVADLSGASLRHANLSEAEMVKTNLSGAILDRANLTDCFLMGADLSRTQMWDTTLSGARLIDADLSRAMIFAANLSQAHLMGADVSETGLLAVNVSGAFFANPSAADRFDGMRITTDTPMRGLRQRQLDEARADPNNPPKLDGVLDAKTSNPLVWRGLPLKDGAGQC